MSLLLLLQGSAELTLTATLFTDADAFGAAHVKHQLSAAAYSDADTFGSHSIGIPLVPTLFIDGDSFGSTHVKHGLIGSRFVHESYFFNASMGPPQVVKAGTNVTQSGLALALSGTPVQSAANTSTTQITGTGLNKTLTDQIAA